MALTEIGMKRIAVIGGGITGITTAYTLAKRGLDVTVYEKHRYAAMETSFANGGQLSASNAEVWNNWQTVMKGIKWMSRRDAPLLVNPKPSWHKLSWFAEFIAAIPQYEKNTTETARLAIAARDHLFAWAQEEGIDFDLKKQGILHIYRDKAGFDHAAKVSRLLAAGGLERRSVTPEEMKSIEPTLAGTYYGGFFTESDSTGDIHKFTNGLADAIQRLGVKTCYGHTVTELSADERNAWVTAHDGTEQTRDTFDGVVNNDVDIRLPAFALTQLAGEHVSEDAVYKLTKSYWENIDEIHANAPFMSAMSLETAFQSLNIPLHVGAYKYYKEMGVTVPDELLPPELK